MIDGRNKRFRVGGNQPLVEVVYAPDNGYPRGAQFPLIDARLTLHMGGFEPGTILKFKGRTAMVEINNRLSKQIFTLNKWR